MYSTQRNLLYNLKDPIINEFRRITPETLAQTSTTVLKSVAITFEYLFIYI